MKTALILCSLFALLLLVGCAADTADTMTDDDSMMDDTMDDSDVMADDMDDTMANAEEVSDEDVVEFEEVY